MTDTERVVENLLKPDSTARNRHLFGSEEEKSTETPKHIFPKRILSFDGGGVRGAISVAFLERIEQIFSEHQHKLLSTYIEDKERAGINNETVEAARKKLVETFRLADWFDLVGGTSTGALIAGAVALGFNTVQIKSFYTDRAKFIFQRPFWRIPGLQAKFDARALQQEIDTIVEERKLDSADLITGLSVVAKRMDTGSPWIITNNPRSPYWDDGPDYIGNRYYRLGTLVRASTAAPHFFDPEIVQILAEEDRKKGTPVTREEVRGWLDRLNDKLGQLPRLTMLLTRIRALMIAERKGPNPKTHGLFVDGGVTPFNNPSFAILMQVVLKPFGLCWNLGPDQLTFVSIGTGAYRTKVSFEELGWSRNVKLALSSLLSMMGDTQMLALAQMQWLGECAHPWKINSEIGDLSDELPPGQRWFRFMRYDLGLDRLWFKEKLGVDASDEDIASFQNMDDPSIIPIIYEHASEAARRQVKPEHFFPNGPGVQTGSA